MIWCQHVSFCLFFHVFIAAAGTALAFSGWMARSDSYRADEKQKGLCQHYFYFIEAKRTRSPRCYFCTFFCHCRSWGKERAVHWCCWVKNIWCCWEAGSLCWLSGCYLHDSKQAKCCYSGLLYVLLLSDASGVRRQFIFLTQTITILKSYIHSWENVDTDHIVLVTGKAMLFNAFTSSVIWIFFLMVLKSQHCKFSIVLLPMKVAALGHILFGMSNGSL